MDEHHTQYTHTFALCDVNTPYRVKLFKYLWLDVHRASTYMHVRGHALHERWYLHSLTPTKLVQSGDHALQPLSPAKISYRWTISPIENDRLVSRHAPVADGIRNPDEFILHQPSRR